MFPAAQTTLTALSRLCRAVLLVNLHLPFSIQLCDEMASVRTNKKNYPQKHQPSQHHEGTSFYCQCLCVILKIN